MSGVYYLGLPIRDLGFVLCLLLGSTYPRPRLCLVFITWVYLSET